MSTFIAPEFNRAGFTCPHCNAFSKQNWEELYVDQQYSISKAECDFCHQLSVWFGGSTWNGSRRKASEGFMIFPDATNIPLPNEDLEEDIKVYYLEASSIVSKSPRGSCALLRLALQKLMIQVGQSGTDINKDIGNLVATRGLDPSIQQALDTVRIIGNESVHPGTIDMDDNTQMAFNMFGLINIVANYLITQPRMISETYGTLPPEKLKGVEDRDT